jgi:hypothetical protein
MLDMTRLATWEESCGFVWWVVHCCGNVICRKEESESQRSLVVLCAKSTGMCPLDYEGTLPFGIEQHLFALAREPNMV